MKQTISWLLFLILLKPCALHAVDTDGDGLLDLLDVSRFDPTSSSVNFSFHGHIEDLDGASLLTNLHTLNLRTNRITSIENGDFHGLANLHTLDLGLNLITNVEHGAFTGLTNLQSLELGSNRIANIANGDFHGLTNLQTLDLRTNEIGSIENGALNGLTSLLSLELGWNRLANIANGDFHGLTNLQTLDLQRSKIANIENGAFTGLTNLQSLDLDLNFITRVESDDLHGLTNLRSLDLSNNRITSIPSGAFAELTNLQSLKLNSNQISSLESGDFEGLTNLQTLRLHANQITSIGNGAFTGLPNLRELMLSGPMRKLNLTNATFENLREFNVGLGGIDSLVLDGAILSNESFDAILSGVTGIGEFWGGMTIDEVSIIGAMFSDGNPRNMDNLLSIPTLNSVTVDPQLYDLFAVEFQAFDALDGKSVTIAAHPTRLACDFDEDSLCGVEDIDMLMNTGSVNLGVPIDGSGNELFDLDDSGVIDETDVSQWLELTAIENGFAEPFKLGDANLDGAVDPLDLNALGQAWLRDGATWSTGDFNGDSIVNEVDLNEIGKSWLQSIATAEATAAVPEPTTNGLYLLAAVMLTLRYHRRNLLIGQRPTHRQPWSNVADNFRD